MSVGNSKKYLFANPKAQYGSLKDEIDKAIRNVLESDTYILGTQVKLFEEEFAKYVGHEHCIGVGSGTDAIMISLRTLGIGAGDEVIIPSFTAVATAAAVIGVGAKPVFVDIDPVTYTVDPDQMDNLKSPNTKAVILVHLYGHPGKVQEIASWCKKNSIFFIEDCAQAHGAEINGKKVGSFGDLSCFSFYPTKNLGGIGDGGAITTNSQEYCDKAIKLRQYGWDTSRNSVVLSQVSRLDELQAGILRIKLRKLESLNQRRISIAKRYAELLDASEIKLPQISMGSKHVFHLFVVRVNDRARYLKELSKFNIFPGIHYELPVHLNDAYRTLALNSHAHLSVTEQVSKEVISLPMYPELTEGDILYISEKFNTI